MATVAHKNLTGTQLHEPKGVAAAAANLVYVTNGAGSGTHQKLTADQLTGTGNPFGAQLFHGCHQPASGTDAGTFTTGDWRKRNIGGSTATTNEISSATLTANVISLPAGTYYVEASAPGYKVDNHQIRLYNTTDGAVLRTGSSEYAGSAVEVQTRSFLSGRFTLSGTKNIELQHWCSSTKTTNGLGLAGALGTESYADIKIWKIA